MEQTDKQKKAPLAARLLALVFVAYLGVGGVANVFAAGPAVWQQLRAGGFNRQTLLAVEETYADQMAGRMAYVELHGAAQGLMLKNEVGGFDVVRDAQGYLHLNESGISGPVLWSFVDYTAAPPTHLGAIGSYCSSQGLPFVCVVPPRKVQPGFTRLPAGVQAHYAESDASFATAVRAMGVDVLDLQESPQLATLPPQQRFYVTDHHWTVEAAFLARQTLLDHLEGYGLAFPNRAQTDDLANYNQVVYKDLFLGSIGRRTGRLYAGVDAFTLITPAFETQLAYTENGKTTQGSFEEVLVHKRFITEQSYYWRNCYAAYLGSDQAERTIHNPNGQGRLLMVQNSMGLPFTAFLALDFETITVLDLRHYNELSLLEYIQQNPGYDAVVCLGNFDMGRFVP